MDFILIIFAIGILFYGYRGYRWYHVRMEEKRRNERQHKGEA
jgi:hypothetical protein